MAIVTLDAKLVRDAVCPPGKAKIDLYSDTIPGWVLEVRKTGGKTWYLRYRESKHGSLRQFKIGDASAISFDKARLAAQTLRSRVVLGQDPVGEKTAVRSIPTMAEVIEQHYIIGHLRLHGRNIQATLSYLRNHVLSRFGRYHLDEITTEMLSAAHRDMLQKGYSMAMANLLPTRIKAIYNFCKQQKIPGASSNPAQGLKLPDPKNARSRFLSREETARLLDAAKESENPQLQYLIPLLILLSCRKRELLDAKWADFDLDRRTWRIPMSKSGRPRTVPVPHAAIEILQQLPRWESVPWVIPSVKTKKPMTSFYLAFDNARKRANLPDFRCHDLRRTGATYLLETGADLVTISKILGHSSLKYVQTYSVASEERLLSAVDAAANSFGQSWLEPQKTSVPA